MKWKVLHFLNRLVDRVFPRGRSALESVYFALALATGPRSLSRYLRLLLTPRGGGLGPRPPVEVSLRGHPHPVFLRPGTTDAIVAYGTFGGAYHLPQNVVLPDDATILDLGANNGLTAADFAARYPRAAVIAVELDDANAEMARMNTAVFGDRVTIIHGAAWWEATQLSYVPVQGEEWGFAVTEAGDREVAAIAVGDLVDRYGPVDYLKIDIEGAEREVLTRNVSWASEVGAIQVEVHEPYTLEQCEHDLQKLGFVTERSPHTDSVNATRSVAQMPTPVS